jgi:alpha-1,2-mannosyltransferase
MISWLPIAIGAAWLTVVWVQIVAAPQGDFPRHWEQGRRLLAGEFIYADGLNVVYPPLWALAHAPLTIMSAHTAQVVVYPLALLALAFLLRTLAGMSAPQLPLPAERAVWSAAAAVTLAAPFVSRDLPEVGVNTALVALSWLAVALWSRGRDVAAGMSLGLAAALKCTPLLFVAYFALKRQWRVAAVSALACAAFTLSPALVQGPGPYARAMEAWLATVWRGVTEPDPSRGPLGEQKVESLALRPALARYLMRLPPGHLGRPESSDVPERPHGAPSPFYLHVGALAPRPAGIVATIVMAGLLLLAAWRCRFPPDGREDPAIPWEAALVSILILLYSPITWKQHCVGALPALYLVCRHLAAGRALPRAALGALAGYTVLVVLLNRALVGRDITKLLDGYHVKTLALLLLGGVTLACLDRARRTGARVAAGRAA